MNNYRLKIIFTLSAILIFIIGFFIVPSTAIKGISDGLTLCSTVIIPSLFPFIFISDFFVRSGLCSIVGTYISPAVNFLFRLPGCAGCAILMSLIGGYPVGAKMTAQLLEEGSITASQGRRMMIFCVNAGPAFVIGTVGSVMLSSVRAGVCLFAATVISSLLLAFVMRFFGDKTTQSNEYIRKDFSSDVLSQSVFGATNSMLMLCAWVLLFSCVNALLFTLPMPKNVTTWLGMITEVTGGCLISVHNFPLGVTALVIGWAGLSVHCQVYPFVRQTGLKYSHFCLARLIHGSVATLVAQLLFKIFPCEVSVFSTHTEALPKLFSVSAPAAVAMLVLSAFVIVDGKRVEKS